MKNKKYLDPTPPNKLKIFVGICVIILIILLIVFLKPKDENPKEEENNVPLITTSSPMSTTSSPILTPTPTPTPNPNIGTIWRGITIPSTSVSYWRSIVFGNGKFVAIAGCTSGCSNGTPLIMTSEDGENWIVRTTLSNSSQWNWWVVNFENNLFVITSSSNPVILISNDGINWRTPNIPLVNFTNEGSVSSAYGNGIWVVLSFTGKVLRSNDGGSNWNLSDSGLNKSWQSIAFGDNLFVAVSSLSTPTAPMYSEDNGQTWTLGTLSSNATGTFWNSVFYGNGLWIAVSARTSSSSFPSRVFSSTNGKNWTSVSGLPDGTNSIEWQKVFYANNIWVVIGKSTNKILTSNNGEFWTLRDGPVSKTWLGLSFGNNKWVAVGQQNAINSLMVSP